MYAFGSVRYTRSGWTEGGDILGNDGRWKNGGGDGIMRSGIGGWKRRIGVGFCCGVI